MNEKEYISPYCRFMGIYFLCLIVNGMAAGTLGSMLKLVALIPIGIWLFTNHTVQLKSMIIKASALFVLWCFMSNYWTIDQSTTMKRAITQITFLVFLLSTTGYEYSSYELVYLKKCLVWSSRISAVVLLTTGSYGAGRLLLSGIITEDPTYLCAYLMFGICFAVSVIISQNNRVIQKMAAIIELAVYLYIVFATGSRGGLFSTATVIIILIAFYKNESNKFSIGKKIFIVSFLIIGVGVVMTMLPDEVAYRFLPSTIQESNGTGRYELWRNALNAFGNSSFLRQLFGYGTSTAKDITYMFPFSRHNVFHNIYIENLLEIGIIGLVLYLIHIVSFFISAVRQRNLFAVAIQSGLMVLAISSSLYSFKPYWNIMIFILCNELSVYSETDVSMENV